MKAIVKTHEGPGGISWQDWPDPEPKGGQVLVAVHSAGICSTDVAIYNGTYRGRHPVRSPSMLGHEAAGTVVEVADGVEEVRRGDRVALQVIWGHAHAPESLLGHENLDPDWFHIGASALGGAFAERIAVRADRTIKIPDGVGWEDAALLEPVAVAAHAMDLVDLRPSERFVVVGPGPFGLLMTQIARATGASRVVVVGVDGVDDARLDVARRVGADETIGFAGDIDGTADMVRSALGGRGADVVMDCGGTSESTLLSLDVAAPAARVAVFGFTREATIEPLRQIVRKGLSLFGVSAAARRHYGLAMRMIEARTARPAEIVSHRLAIADAGAGLELHATRQASKVLLTL